MYGLWGTNSSSILLEYPWWVMERGWEIERPGSTSNSGLLSTVLSSQTLVSDAALAHISPSYGGSVAKLCVTLVTAWTIACQAPLSMGFSRQEYWSGLPFPSLGDLPHPGIEPGSPALQADSFPTELREKPKSRHILNSYLLHLFLWIASLLFTPHICIWNEIYTSTKNGKWVIICL